MKLEIFSCEFEHEQKRTEVFLVKFHLSYAFCVAIENFTRKNVIKNDNAKNS